MVVVVGLFFFPGVLFWVIALVLFLRGRSGGRGGIDVEGEVYAHGDYVSRGQQMFFPKFRAVVNGQTLLGNGTTATTWQRPPVGTKVKLVHVPGDAEIPLRERGVPTGTLIGIVMLLVFGTAFLVIGTLAVTASAQPSADDGDDTPAHHVPGAKREHRKR